MTTVYNDYYAAYSNGDFDVTNVNFDCKLVYEGYIPDPSHKPSNVTQFIITSTGALKDDIISTKTMDEIIEHLKTHFEGELDLRKEEAKTAIEQIFVDDEKSEKVKTALDRGNNGDYMFDFWRELTNNGIKYMIVESSELGILCFCEEIT